MSIALHPRAAPADTVRVWVGVDGQVEAPELTWRLDGAEAKPRALRPLQSARGPALLRGSPPRVFAGVYEFRNVTPGTHEIVVTAAGRERRLTVRTLPRELPESVDGWFNILLVSCYHEAEAERGVLDAALYEITREHPLHLSILLGDQVYLDLPTLEDFPNDKVWLAERFERSYRRNWFGDDDYAAVLSAAPSVATPDDHEYWNNFPHASPIIGNTYTPKGRAAWTEAAAALYRAFQMPVTGEDGEEFGDPFVIDVPPMSLFVADSRSLRRPDRSRSFGPRTLERLEEWVRTLRARGWLGVFATGQSLFDPAASTLSGAVGDRVLANYGDYSKLVETLSEAPQAIAITGDVHFGRVVSVLDVDRELLPTIHEVITSPSSLVTSVGIDGYKKAVNWLDRLRGGGDDWPRHSEAEPAPAYFAEDVLRRRRFSTRTLHRQKGDQLAVLSLKRHGTGILGRVTYYPLHSSHAVRARHKASVELAIPSHER